MKRDATRTGDACRAQKVATRNVARTGDGFAGGPPKLLVNFGGKQSRQDPSGDKARQDPSGATVLTGPTVLTLARMLLAVAFAIFAMFPDLWAKITALAIFIVASLTDKLDGIWARKTGQVTDLGAFLDPLADKMLVSLAFLILVYQNIVPLWVFAIILVRDLAVDGMRMTAARNKITISASFLGKLKTTVQMVALILLLLGQIITSNPLGVAANIALYLALALTVISGANYLIKGRTNFTKPPKK